MSDESEDDYAEFGTPLEPLDEEDCPRKKPLTIEEQIATDQYGRRRFHGAFTGGFSAGFLNTVGSLEGWRPSSFKSSRSEKGSAIVQKPEHFMDEEDMGEFGIAPSLLRAKEDYHNTRKNKRKYPVSSSSVLGMSILKSLIQPAKETIGIKLLKKMGWKPGQGVGPRISKQEKKRIDKIRKKVYGCSLPNEKSSGDTDSDDDDDEDDEELKNITFAPKDYPFQLVTPKENLFGIGYKGLEKRSILSVQRQQTEFELINKRTITGQAFGVGAFEEEDEDIYSKDDMTQYDFMLSDAKEAGSASGCITGEDLYDAFVLALKKATKKLFPPPVLPGNFKPVRKFSRFEPIPEPQDPKKTRLSPEKKSPAEEIEEIQKEARKVTQNVSEIRQGTFKPFIADTDKQARYEKYLKLVMLGKQGELSKLQPVTMTEWEKERERIEFEQASKLFKPLSGIMEDRFTTGSLPDDLNDPLAKVEKFKSGSEEQIKAAKMEMYGRLTRTVEDWKPASLLCKRFNVPELNMNEIPIVKTKPKYSIFDNLKPLTKEPKSKPPEIKVEKLKTADTEQTAKPVDTEKTAKPRETKASENAMLSNLPENKIDLFNAIFLDTDSEDEAGDEGSSTKEQEKQLEKQNECVYEDAITNNERNTSPPRGIFENLDFNFLLSSKQPSESKEVSKAPQKEDKPKIFENKPVEDKNEMMDTDLTYGPKLPDKFSLKKIDFIPPPVINSDCWVEKTEHRKHKKKDKKQKKSKHKSKHKHKSKK